MAIQSGRERLLAVLGLTVFSLSTLVSCGGGDSCDITQSCGDEVSGSTSTTAVTPPVVTDSCDITQSCSDDDPQPPPAVVTRPIVTTYSNYLDCSSLDPDKVYLHGTLSEGAAYLDALVDPEDPTKFCVGFPQSAWPGVITEAGKYIYADDLNLTVLLQDNLGANVTGGERRWLYPETPTANDTVLFTSTAPSCGIGLILVNPSDDTVFYSCPNDTINTQASEPYYDLVSDDLLAITGDGAMLINSSGALRVVDAAMTETSITTPSLGPGTISYLTAKLFTDAGSGNPSVWVVVQHDTDELRRWAIDLVTLAVTDDGEFTPVPAGSDAGFSAKLDGNGDLWQFGRSTITVTDDLILKRPILSSGVPSTIVYDEGDDTGGSWYFEDFPFVKIHISSLVTGS